MQHARATDRPTVRSVRSTDGVAPPYDEGAEQAVISAVFVDPACLPAVLDTGCDASSFFLPAHRALFAAFLTLHTAQQPIDVVTVATHLRESGAWEQAGGARYLNQIVDTVPAVSNVPSYAATVVRNAKARALIAALQHVVAGAYQPGADIAALEAEARAYFDAHAPAGPSTAGVVSVEDFCVPSEAPDYLVPALGIAPGAPVMFAGYGYSGKTMLAQALAVSVITGRRILGHQVRWDPDRRRVVHLDYEQGRFLCVERYQRITRAAGYDVREIAENMSLVPFPDVYLDQPGAERVLAKLCENAALLIVDSLRASSPSLDENSSEMRRPLDLLGRISEKTGVVPLVIHHAKKAGGDPDRAPDPREMARGSSAIFDACNSVFLLHAKKGQPTKVMHHKERFRAATVDDFGLRVVDVPHADDDTGEVDERWGLRVDTCDPEMPTPAANPQAAVRARKDAIARVLRDAGHAGLSVGRICEFVRGRKAAILDDLREMVQDLELDERTGERGAKVYTARLS